MERIMVISAIWDSGLEVDASFTIDSVHESDGSENSSRGNWTIIITPTRGRLYLLRLILGLVDSLDLDIAACLDINRPGCLVFH